MTEGIVTVGSKKYVSGLYWENSPSGRVAQAAREAARQPSTHANFYAVRTGNKSGRIPQFGLCQGGQDYKSGMPVLAASLADQQPGSWAGAFRLREGIAVIVVRDDLIVPDGDQFFLDESEARDRLLQEIALGGLSCTYAPENWGVPGADSMPISLLMNDLSFVRLRSVSLSKNAKILLIGGVSVVALVIGIGWYMADQEAKRLAEQQAQLEAFELAKRKADNLFPDYSKPPEYPVPERTWEKEPKPLDLIDACNKASSKLRLIVAGWRLETVTCTKTGVTQTWARSGGFSLPPEDMILNDQGTAASLTLPFENLAARGEEILVGRNEITKRYLSQNWSGTLTPQPDDPPPPPPPEYKGPWNPPPKPWIKRAFSLNVPALPSTLETYFKDVPGVVIKSLSISSTNIKSYWIVEGVIYEDRQ